jgi:hypothetical protein
MSDIRWPVKYLPGPTDNYVSNEVIVNGLNAKDVWPYLNNATMWPSYYDNASNVGFDDRVEPELSLHACFRFTTFGLDVEAEVTEYEPPVAGTPARVAWRAWADSAKEEALDVLHAWLIENLPGNRVRVLTQESQIGKPALGLAKAKPNPMPNAHQDWLDGLLRTALQAEK